MTKIVFPNSPPIPTVPQPSGDYAWVSKDSNALTEFSMSKDWYGIPTYGAHNYEIGKYISKLNIGDTIAFQEGTPQRGGGYAKKVTGVRRFQAERPRDYLSPLIDLDTGKKYTSTELSKEIYKNKKGTVFQTCIEKDGNINWGRLFVITE
jgi:hypothetical protein